MTKHRTDVVRCGGELMADERLASSRHYVNITEVLAQINGRVCLGCNLHSFTGSGAFTQCARDCARP